MSYYDPSIPDVIGVAERAPDLANRTSDTSVLSTVAMVLGEEDEETLAQVTSDFIMVTDCVDVVAKVANGLGFHAITMIEDANRFEWNILLTCGFKIIRESGMRFDKFSQIAESFP